MFRVKLTKTAEKAMTFLVDSQPKMAQRVAHAIDRLAEEPTIGVPLKGELKGCWKYRIGSYRIVYQIVRKQLVVLILDIGHRKEVYR